MRPSSPPRDVSTSSSLSQKSRANCWGASSGGSKSRRIEEGRRGWPVKCYHGSNSMEWISRCKNVEKIAAHLLDWRRVSTLWGGSHICTTFYASFGLDHAEQFLKGALEHGECGCHDSSQLATPRNQHFLGTSTSSHPHNPQTLTVTYHYIVGVTTGQV